MRTRSKTVLATAVAASLIGITALTTSNASAADVQTIRTTDFVKALSDTRANGLVTVGDNGIGVATTGTDSTAKAAEYWPASENLADAGTPSMTWVGTSPAPGQQLVTDFDGDGKADAILVGESVYNGDWWVSDSAAQFVKDGAPEHTGGSGSANHGTLAEWSKAFPKAHILDYGFSLGSGIQGSGIIKGASLGDTTFNFAGSAAPAAPPATAPQGVAVSSTQSTATLQWSAVPGAQSYEVLNGSSVVGASLDTTATVTGLKSNTNYQLSVRAVGAGQVGPVSTAVSLLTTSYNLTAPTGLKCTAESTTTVHCTANRVTGANLYRFYVNKFASGVADDDTAGYLIQGLKTKTTYKISIASDNDTQAPSPQSTAVSVTTK